MHSSQIHRRPVLYAGRYEEELEVGQEQKTASKQTVGERFLKWLGLDSSIWTVGDRRLALLAISIGLAIVIIAICGYVFGWAWTGLTKPQRTFWDWLSLLIVPIVLALGGYLFNRSESRRTSHEAARQHRADQELASKRKETDEQIADQRRHDDALQAYLNHIGELLLHEDRPLRQSNEGDEVRTLARARTLAVLNSWQRGLGDEDRKRSVLQFLYESKLISKGSSVVDLRDTNLMGAYLTYINLSGADLSGAWLSDAKLYRANLRAANLRGADLSDADLSEADLSGAEITDEQLARVESLEGATMPDGRKYEDWLKSMGGEENRENIGPS